MRSRLSAVLLGVGVFLGVVTTVGVTVVADPPPPGRTVELRLLGVNDFHGNLEPPETQVRFGTGRVALGGAAALDAHLDRAERGFEGRAIRVHAGDMVGASPLVSSWFHDEPAIYAMNRIGFDVGTLGNHEFDEGGAEALRLLRGGQRRDGARAETSDPGFAGASFPYVAANTIDRSTGELVLPPYRVIERDGVRVGFIGVTTEETPIWLLEEHASDYRWLDISDTVNRHTRELEEQDVHAIVVLAHAGAFGPGGGTEGEIVDEAREMSDGVDVIVAGHTHSHLNGRVDGKLIVESWAYGTGIDVIDLEVDRRSGEVVGKSARTPRTWNDEVTPSAGLAALTAEYVRRVAPIADRVVGEAAVPLEDHAEDPRGRLCDLVAAGQRAAGAADFAVTNLGATRGSLDAGPVTYAELFQVHAYEHRLVRMELTGAEVRAMLEQQWTSDGRFVPLAVSGLRYETGPGHIVTRLETEAGEPVEPQATYSLVANELIAAKGAFSALYERGRSKQLLGTDLEALVAWVERLPAGFDATSQPR
jgi:5'-nucleotidase